MQSKVRIRPIFIREQDSVDKICYLVTLKRSLRRIDSQALEQAALTQE